MTQHIQISNRDATNLLDSFINIVKKKSLSKSVKLSSFGTFNFKKSPKRVGRNPKTLDSYIIPELNKLSFTPSNKVKEYIN